MEDTLLTNSSSSSSIPRKRTRPLYLKSSSAGSRIWMSSPFSALAETLDILCVISSIGDRKSPTPIKEAWRGKAKLSVSGSRALTADCCSNNCPIFCILSSLWPVLRSPKRPICSSDWRSNRASDRAIICVVSCFVYCFGLDVKSMDAPLAHHR